MHRRVSHLLAAGAIPLLFLTLVLPGEALSSSFGALVACLSAGFIWRAASVHKPRWQISWRLIAIGFVAGGIAQLLGIGSPSVEREALAGVVGLASMISSGIGVALWLRAAWTGWRSSAVIDVCIISAATGVVLWHGVLERSDLGGGALAIAVASAASVMVSAGVVIRLLEGRTFNAACGYFLLGTFGEFMMLPMQAIFDIDTRRVGALSLAMLVFVAAAAVHPGMTVFTERSEIRKRETMGRYRFTVLCSVLLAGPVIHFQMNGGVVGYVETAVTVGIVIAVMARLSSLIKEREANERSIAASVDRMRAVVDLTREVLRAEALHEAMSEVVAMVHSQFAGAGVALWTVDQNEQIVVSASVGLDASAHASELPLDEMTAEGRCALGGVNQTASGRSAENAEYGEVLAADAFCVPVVGQTGVRGVLALYFDEPHMLVDDEILALEQVATVVCMAVERAEFERDDRQAQKLEAVGRLAAGIAHEINTPVQFVGDNLYFLKDAFGELLQLARGEVDRDAVDLEYLAEEVPLSLGQAQDGVTRVATIVKAMKAFGHPDQSEQSFADINVALENTLIVARNEIKYVAEVEARFGKLPPVLCHVGDLNQVFLNLLVNAAHAIADKHGPDSRGRIFIRTWCDKKSVFVAIGDDGGGVPKELKNKIWEPFFTTKGVGKGTGQGLSLARAVVERHQGKIKLDSDSSGSVFCIQLPIAGAPVGDATGEPVANSGSAAMVEPTVQPQEQVTAS